MILKAPPSATQWAYPKARYPEHKLADEAINIEPSEEESVDRTPGVVLDELRKRNRMDAGEYTKETPGGAHSANGLETNRNVLKRDWQICITNKTGS